MFYNIRVIRSSIRIETCKVKLKNIETEIKKMVYEYVSTICIHTLHDGCSGEKREKYSYKKYFIWHIFGLMVSPRGVNTSKFWDSGFKKEHFGVNFFYCWLSSFYQHWYVEYMSGLFPPNLEIMTSQKKINIPEFWKNN